MWYSLWPEPNPPIQRCNEKESYILSYQPPLNSSQMSKTKQKKEKSFSLLFSCEKFGTGLMQLKKRRKLFTQQSPVFKAFSWPVQVLSPLPKENMSGPQERRNEETSLARTLKYLGPYATRGDSIKILLITTNSYVP